MRRVITILATAALASSLLTATAEARGGGGGHGGGFGGGGHMGGFGGGGHIGGIAGGARMGGLGSGVHIGGTPGRGMDRVAGGRFGIGSHHAMHRFGTFRHGYYDYGLNCYDWYNLHPDYQWPPTCS
jgi:hypothetical protein